MNASRGPSEAYSYACKPYGPREVVARSKSVLRRVDPLRPADSNDQARMRVDMMTFEAYCGDQRLDLTPVELRLLNTLLTRQAGCSPASWRFDPQFADRPDTPIVLCSANNHPGIATSFDHVL